MELSGIVTPAFWGGFIVFVLAMLALGTDFPMVWAVLSSR